jgi:hypothetical protein
MQLQLFVPCSQLQPYVQSISYFESAYGTPTNDLRTIVPNGDVKLLFPCRSRLQSLIEGHKNDYPEMTWWVVGQMEKPAVIEASPGISMISINLNAWGAYKLLPLGMKELTDRSVLAGDIWGSPVHELEEQLAYAATPEKRVALLQTFLVHQLERSSRSDAFVDYTLHCIQARQGQVRIEELCREAGYTKQHLDRR